MTQCFLRRNVRDDVLQTVSDFVRRPRDLVELLMDLRVGRETLFQQQPLTLLSYNLQRTSYKLVNA